MLTEPIRELFAVVAEKARAKEPDGSSVLEINGVISAAASVYEKVRYLVDYREEHTIRRAAIERVIKRHVLIERRAAEGSALVQELLESRYIPREFATDEKIQEIDEILQRYMRLQYDSGRRWDIAQMLFSLAATEIESHISSFEHTVDQASAEALYKVIRPNIVLGGYTQEQIDVQVFCACRRSLLSSDDASLQYALWLMFVPEWETSKEIPEGLAQRLDAIRQGLQHAVANPIQWQIAHRIKNESIYFRIIREILMQKFSEAESILSNPAKLEAFTRDFLAKKYEKENARIQSSGIRAVIYLFISKMAIALALEVPYESFVLGTIHYVPLGINLLFHPIFLFVLTRRVRSLGENNTLLILKGLHRVLYEGKGRAIRVYTQYTQFTKFFGFFYVLLFLGVFGAIITVLQYLAFSEVGSALFLFFLALVSYFTYRIRSNARRWRITGNETTLVLIANMLAVPIIRAGRWLSRTFSSVNIFVMIMDFIIETPFRLILNFSHQFILYLKEKADEVY